MKKLIKKISLILVIVLMLGLMVGCGKGPESSGNSNDEGTQASDTYTLRINANGSENELKGTAFGRGMYALKEECERESGGRLKIDIYPSSQLGGSVSEIIGGSQLGAFEIFNLASNSWGEYTDAFLPVCIPYLFTDEDVLKEFMKSPVGEKIEAKVLEDTGAKVIFYGYQGFRNIINNVRPIKTPDDLKGLKLRVLPDKYTIKAFESLGASTLQIPYSELYTSVQQGLIDGLDSPYDDIAYSKLYEVVKYLSTTHNVYNLGVECIAQSAYDKLPDDLKVIFDKACEKAQEVASDNKRFEQESKDEVKGKMEIIELTDEQLQLFTDASAPVYKMAQEELGAEMWQEIIDEIEKIEARIK